MKIDTKKKKLVIILTFVISILVLVLGVYNIYMLKNTKIRIKIEEATNEYDQMHSGAKVWHKINIENLSDTILENLELQIISKELKNIELKIKNSELIEEKAEKFYIKKINAKENISLDIQGIIKEDASELNSSVMVKDKNGKIYKSNNTRQNFSNIDMEISMTSLQNGKEIKRGDLVDYNILVKNIGEVAETADIESIIPDELQVESISIDGKVIKQRTNDNEKETYWKNISNKIQEDVMLEVGQTVSIKIMAKVLYIADYNQGKITTNYATVETLNTLKDTSEMITHILKTNNDNVENVISGIAWLDGNENGQMDGNEEKLQGVTVRLYNTDKQEYLKDNNRNDITAETNYKGEYSFSKVEKGTYLVVFFYDSGEYELTTSLEEMKTSITSKASIKITQKGEHQIKLIASEIKDLNGNRFEENIGLKKTKEEGR